MAIKYNDATLSTIKYNSSEIYLGKYNSTTVYEKMVTYTFPNAYARMTSDTSLGIKCYYDERAGESYTAYKAFDNSLTTAYIGSYTSDQAQGKVGIVFPFNIQVQSVTIKNANPNPKSSSNVGGLASGWIYMSSSAQTTVTYTDIKYAAITRSNPTTAGGSTTHTNSSYATTNVRSIRVSGGSWGNGSSYWHVIGEISITFKVVYSSLKSWADTYGITLSI